MFARRSAAKVLARHQYRRTLISRIVQHEVVDLLTLCAEAPVVKQKLSETRSLDALQKLLGNNLIGINVNPVKRSDESRMFAKWLHSCLPKLPLPNIRKMPFNRCRRRHHRTDQVRPPAAALPSFKVAVAGRRAPLAGLQNVRIHAQTHRAS